MKNHEKTINKIASEKYLAYGDIDIIKSLRAISLAGGKFKSDKQKGFFFAKVRTDAGKLVSYYPLLQVQVLEVVNKFMPANANAAFYNTDVARKNENHDKSRADVFGVIYYFNNEGLVRAIQTKYELDYRNAYNDDVYKGGRFRDKYQKEFFAKDFKAINKKDFQ